MIRKDAIYQHVKGGYYVVIGTFSNNDGGPDIVGYRPMYGGDVPFSGKLYWRTLTEFTEMVNFSNKGLVPRFTEVTAVPNLNRAYKSDCRNHIFLSPDKNHSAYVRITEIIESQVEESINDLKNGCENAFLSREDCDPVLYLYLYAEMSKNPSVAVSVRDNKDVINESIFVMNKHKSIFKTNKMVFIRNFMKYNTNILNLSLFDDINKPVCGF